MTFVAQSCINRRDNRVMRVGATGLISSMRNESDPRVYWNSLATTYDSLYQTTWALREDAETQQILIRCAALGPCHDILDLGCGSGLCYKLLRPYFTTMDYIGIDISKIMVEKLLNDHPEVRGVISSTEAALSTFSDLSFDCIFSINVAMSFPNDTQDILRGIERILRANGRFVLSFLNKYSLRRLIRLRFGMTEIYRTRGDVAAGRHGVRASVFSARELVRLCANANLKVTHIDYQSVLGGVLEGRLGSKMEPGLAALMPQFAHAIIVSGEKMGD
jgi:SAM-dependent methyltransferase